MPEGTVGALDVGRQRVAIVLIRGVKIAGRRPVAVVSIRKCPLRAFVRVCAGRVVGVAVHVNEVDALGIVGARFQAPLPR